MKCVAWLKRQSRLMEAMKILKKAWKSRIDEKNRETCLFGEMCVKLVANIVLPSNCTLALVELSVLND